MNIKNIFKLEFPTIKSWMYGIFIGLTIGFIFGYQQAYTSVLKDCRILGMFRIGDIPISCTYHLVTLQDPETKPKGRK